jgi:hypothetical protein
MAQTEELRLTQPAIRDLLASQGPCVTLVLPARDTATRTKFRTALNDIRQQLKGKLPDEELESLLEPVNTIDPAADPKRHGSKLILRSPEVFHQIPVNIELTETATAGDHFSVRAILTAAAAQKYFYLLALSQNRMRILRCTDTSSEELPWPAGVPASLEEAMQTRKPDHVLDNMHTGGPSTGSMRGVMFGTSSDADDKDEYMLHFFMEVEKGLKPLLKGSEDPLVVVGVEHELALYKRVNTYPNLFEPGVHGSADGLEGGEIHTRALQLLAEHPAGQTQKLLSGFDKKIGTGHASTHIHDMVIAAHQGRVSHFFFQESARYPGTFDAVRSRVKRTEDELDQPIDLIDFTVLETLRNGGEAMIEQASHLPNGVPACALFRYPEPVAVAAGSGTASPEVAGL